MDDLAFDLACLVASLTAFASAVAFCLATYLPAKTRICRDTPRHTRTDADDTDADAHNTNYIFNM